MTQTRRLLYIVEHHPFDLCLLQETFSNRRLAASLHFFANGAELFIRLTHRLDGRLPDLIILNEDSPIMNGFETRKLLEQSKEYRPIPVLMRSSLSDIQPLNRYFDPLTSQVDLPKARQPLTPSCVVSPQEQAGYLTHQLIKAKKMNRGTTEVLVASVSFTSSN